MLEGNVPCLPSFGPNQFKIYPKKYKVLNVNCKQKED